MSDELILENQIAIMRAVLMILSYTQHPILGDCHSTAPYTQLRDALHKAEDIQQRNKKMYNV